MNFKNLALIGTALLLSSPAFATAVLPVNTYFGGFEDSIHADYDYNDIVFSLSGSGLTLNTSGKYYAQPALNNSGTPFWNNLSYDKPSNAYNVGFCIYGGGACNGGKALDPGAQFLASANSPAQSAFDVTFSVKGNVSANVILSVASDTDHLGYYLLSDPNHTLHSLGTAGNTYSFTPGGDFGLYGFNGTQTFYSQCGMNNLDPNTSHFAFFTAAPEPGMMSLVGAGLLSVGVFFRRKPSAKN